MIRVGADAVPAATAEPHVTRMTLGGKALAAFVLVEPAGYADDVALEAWLARGLAFVAGPPGQRGSDTSASAWSSSS